jgi:hypothetical protein
MARFFFLPSDHETTPVPHAVWRRLCLALSSETVKFNSDQGYHGFSGLWELVILMRLENKEGPSFSLSIYLYLC